MKHPQIMSLVIRMFYSSMIYVHPRAKKKNVHLPRKYICRMKCKNFLRFSVEGVLCSKPIGSVRRKQTGRWTNDYKYTMHTRVAYPTLGLRRGPYTFIKEWPGLPCRGGGGAGASPKMYYLRKFLEVMCTLTLNPNQHTASEAVFHFLGRKSVRIDNLPLCLSFIYTLFADGFKRGQGSIDPPKISILINRAGFIP